MTKNPISEARGIDLVLIFIKKIALQGLFSFEHEFKDNSILFDLVIKSAIDIA